MWIVHAGNRIDAPDRAVPRFPAGNVEWFERRLRRFLGELRPTGVVSAAAAGADLLMLDVANELGIRIEIVLPLPIDEFVARSVADQGAEWEARFARVLPDPARATVEDLSHLDDWYLRGNDAILDHAQSVAGDERVLGVAVRPPLRIDHPSATDDFVTRARGRGLTVIDLDPSEQRLPRAFIVMPFGRKADPARPSTMIDCDETFRKLIVPLVEDADLDWQRADRATEAGMVHVGMFNELANADVVVVDLTLENANVLYELGMRHALRGRSTILLHRTGGASMFDLRPLREFRYDLAGDALTDDEALQAISQIAPALRDARRPGADDSPLHALFDIDPQPEVRPRAGAERIRVFDQLQERLAGLERDAQLGMASIDDEAITSLVDEILAVDVDLASRRALIFRLGTLLRQDQRYLAALSVFDRQPFGDVRDVSFAETRKEQALCHRRLGEARLAEGGDPEGAWAVARSLLDEAFATHRPSADVFGVAGGLEKRRADLAIQRGDRTTALVTLETAARWYGDGLETDPTNYYLLLNRTTSLRLLGQHFGVADALVQARDLLPVARFFAKRAANGDPRDVYAAASVGELAYTAARIDLGGDAHQQADAETEEWYARAVARGASHDQRLAMIAQLDIYERLDGPTDVIARVRARLRDALRR